MAEEKNKYDEKARKVLQAIKDTKRCDDPETILVTYNRKQLRLINIEKDLGDLENTKFGSLHSSIIIFETGFKLFTKQIESIEIVSVKKKVFSKEQEF